MGIFDKTPDEVIEDIARSPNPAARVVEYVRDYVNFRIALVAVIVVGALIVKLWMWHLGG